MSIPAAAPARLQELLQINGRLTAERDALLAAAGTLDESRSKVAELQAVAQVAECARDEAAQRLAAGSPRSRNASWMTRDRRRSPAQPKRRRTSRPETWRGQSFWSLAAAEGGMPERSTIVSESGLSGGRGTGGPVSCPGKGDFLGSTQPGGKACSCSISADMILLWHPPTYRRSPH